MKTIIVDLELTQVTGRKPQIIQIGAVLINTKSYKVLKSFDIICKPGDAEDRIEGLGDIRMNINPTANPEGRGTITELTGITAEMVEAGTPIAEALELWWSWVDEAGCGGRIYDWGGGDIELLTSHSNDRNIEIGRRIKSLDIKQLAGIVRQMFGVKAKGGLKRTMDVFGLPFLGQEHNALDDAFNTGSVLLYIMSLTEKMIMLQKELNFKNDLLANFAKGFGEIRDD